MLKSSKILIQNLSPIQFQVKENSPPDLKIVQLVKISCGNYRKDDEQNTDCGKDDATKGDNWESTGAPLLL